MRTVITVLMFILFSGSAAIAYPLSLEITTGSGAAEGVKDREGRFLKNGAIVQVLSPADGIIHLPSKSGQPTGGDVLIGTSEVGYNFPFNPDSGKFNTQVSSSGRGFRIFVRLWNGPTPLQSDEYGDSEIYIVTGMAGETWNIGGKGDSPAIVLDKLRKDLD